VLKEIAMGYGAVGVPARQGPAIRVGQAPIAKSGRPPSWLVIPPARIPLRSRSTTDRVNPRFTAWLMTVPRLSLTSMTQASRVMVPSSAFPIVRRYQVVSCVMCFTVFETVRSCQGQGRRGVAKPGIGKSAGGWIGELTLRSRAGIDISTDPPRRVTSVMSTSRLVRFGSGPTAGDPRATLEIGDP